MRPYKIGQLSIYVRREIPTFYIHYHETSIEDLIYDIGYDDQFCNINQIVMSYKDKIGNMIFYGRYITRAGRYLGSEPCNKYVNLE